MEYFFRNYYLATSYVLTDIYPVQYGEQQCEEGYAFGPRIRSNYILHYVYSGCGILRIGNQEYSVNAGELFLIKPNQVAFYKADTKSPWLYRWIEFNGSMAERIVSAFGKDGARPVLFDEGGVIGDKFIDFISQGKMAFEPAMERFWGIISGLTKSSADSAPIRSQDYVQMAEQYMKDNLHRKISVDGIAAHIGINRSYLSRLFKKHKNVSPQQYLVMLRVNTAAQYLKNTDISIIEAARSVGYSDYHVFNKAFHSHFNASPSSWRKKQFWQQSFIDDNS